MRRMISKCDGCGIDKETNPNFNSPTDWLIVEMRSNGSNVPELNGDFCSLECFQRKINECLGKKVK